MMAGYFSELQRELVVRSAELSGPPQPRWKTGTAGGRAAAGAVLAVGLTGGVVGLASSGAASGPVSKAPADVVAAVPALENPKVEIPPLVARAFANATDKTVNGALARPLVAGLPGGSLSWVAPAENGACIGVPDVEIDAMAVVCGTTDEIVRRGLSITSFDSDPERGNGVEVGIGHTSTFAEHDGSHARQIR